MLARGEAQIGLQEELLCCRERWERPAGLRPGQAPPGCQERGLLPSTKELAGAQALAWHSGLPLTRKGSRRAPKVPSPKAAPTEKVGWGCFFTSLDHLGQVGLSKNLGHPEHHQGILGADQVCAESSVQKADKELRVQQQVLLDKRLPLRKQPVEGMVSQRREFLSCPGQRHPGQSAPANPGCSMCGTSWHWREDWAPEKLTKAAERPSHQRDISMGAQCPHVSSNGQGWRKEGPGKHPNSRWRASPCTHTLPPLPNLPCAWSKGSWPDLQGPQGPQPRTHHFSDTLRSGASALGGCFSGAYLQGCK